MAKEQKGWIYIRAWSDESQKDQENLLRNYAVEHRYTIVGQSCDLHVPHDGKRYGLASSWSNLGSGLGGTSKV